MQDYTSRPTTFYSSSTPRLHPTPVPTPPPRSSNHSFTPLSPTPHPTSRPTPVPTLPPRFSNHSFTPLPPTPRPAPVPTSSEGFSPFNDRLEELTRAVNLSLSLVSALLSLFGILPLSVWLRRCIKARKGAVESFPLD